MADSPFYGIGLCGGALGLELGLECAISGYRTVCVVERETSVAGRMAQRIKEGSLPELAWWDDVGTFDGRTWRGIVSILSAGFPCQPFSVAGKRKGKEDERWIWPDIKRIIGEIEPEIVFLENVPGLLLSTDSDFDRWDVEDSPVDSVGGFGTVLSDLAELGFNVEWMCLRASDVGASHGRKRVFILAYRDGARLGRYAWQHDGGSPPLPARSGECGGPVGNPSNNHGGRGERGKEERTGSEEFGRRGFTGIYGALDHSDLSRRTRALSETRTGRESSHEHGASLADTGDGQLQEPRRGPEGRTGLGSAGEVVGNADEPGYPIRGDDSGLRECAAVERTSGGLAHPPSRSGEHGQDGEAGRSGGRGVLETGEQLGNAESGGRGECGEPSERVGLIDGTNQTVGDSACPESARFERERKHLSGPPDIFAPGPGFAGWETLLVQYPWLRPSYSQAEAESDLRDMVDGMAALVAFERTGALRALGNGVVPLQAAVAFRVLLGRLI